MENNSKYIVAGVGFIWGIVEPTVSLIAICLAMVLIDCFTAWRLNMRVSKAYKDKAKSPEFKSKHAMKMFGQLLVIFALIIVAYWIDTKIGMLGDIRLANAIAGLFVAVELLSVLENESSCNGSKWAKVAQKYVVDKTERHLKIDINNDGKIEE